MERDPALIERIHRDAESMGLSLSREAARRLAEYVRLLEEKAVSLGLVARSDAGRLYERHVLDSLRAATLLGPGDALGYDLGSGAGLPGLVLAAAAPRFRVVLVEARRIRVAFLEMALDRLDLPNAWIAAVRAESLHSHADVVSARAFAPLGPTWQVAGELLRPGGRLVYFAGKSLADPLAAGEEAALRGHPATVSTARVLATSPPLVIMTRK